MNNTLKNMLLILIVILSGLFIWYFIRIAIYIVISVVLSLLGQPIADSIRRIPLGKKKIPLGVSAFVTLLLIILVFGGFVSFFFPLLASQAAFFSALDTSTITQSLAVPLSQTELFLREWNLLEQEESIGQKIVSELMAIVTFERFSSLFSSVINFTIELFIGFLSISFITFFFLKERNLFSGIVIFFTPLPHKKEAGEILAESKVLLRRYFAGLITDLVAVFILISLSMHIIGLPNALVIGFFAGILNVIPYVGPIIATFIGVLLAVSINLEMDFYTQLIPLIISIVASFIIVNTIDIGVLQPLIYSKSVRTHPLEIFIVFLMAGIMGGVLGMIIAIPAYSVIRIFARQFYNRSKLVQSLKDSINNPVY